LQDKECKVSYAPFDVRLPEGVEEEEEISTLSKMMKLLVFPLLLVRLIFGLKRY
jgi:hypothetical protein